MSNFLSRLIARQGGAIPLLEPRILPAFAGDPQGAGEEPWTQAPAPEHAAEVESAVSRMPTSPLAGALRSAAPLARAQRSRPPRADVEEPHTSAGPRALEPPEPEPLSMPLAPVLAPSRTAAAGPHVASRSPTAMPDSLDTADPLLTQDVEQRPAPQKVPLRQVSEQAQPAVPAAPASGLAPVLSDMPLKAGTYPAEPRPQAASSLTGTEAARALATPAAPQPAPTERPASLPASRLPVPTGQSRISRQQELQSEPAAVSAAPVVRVHIGRVQVSTAPPARQALRPAAAVTRLPALSLTDYLKQSAQGGRHE